MAPLRRKKGDGPGPSLAQGPVGVLGVLALLYGILALIFASHSYAADPVDGTVIAKPWLGIGVNGWTSLLFVAAGALLLFGARLHWSARTVALVVGLVLGAASLIAIVDGDDVFGVFAANGATELAWGLASVVLLGTALLPRGR